MKKVSIIGAGQLGSRHLQGLMKGKTEMEVWVVDQSQESLKVAKERCEQVEPHTPKVVHYAVSINDLPLEMDLVIVATGSKPRADIVKSLLEHSSVKYMVLEKFLFTRLNEYEEVGKLLREKGTKCWVDCTRRMFPCYHELAGTIDKESPVVMTHYGQNWGLCCNTVHFIDLWMYLAGDCPFKVNMAEVQPCIVESKRNGYIELFGKEMFESENGDKLTLASYETYSGDSTITIENAGRTIIIDEANGNCRCNGEERPMKLYMQSEFSGALADEILANGESHLVDYFTSAKYHKPYLKAVIDFVNKIQGTESDSCPIT